MLANPWTPVAGLTVMYDKVRAAGSISICLTRMVSEAMGRKSRSPALAAQVGSTYYQMTRCLAMGSGRQWLPYLPEFKELQPTSQNNCWAGTTHWPMSDKSPLRGYRVHHPQSKRSDIAILMAGKTLWVLHSREAHHNSTAPSMTSFIVMGKQQQTKHGFCTAYSG